MKKTVIISPYQKDVSGTLEHELAADKLRVRLRLNHPAYNRDDILRLYVMSTAHAARRPYLAEIFDAESEELYAEIDKNIANGSGYNITDFDTYVVTRFNDTEETAVAAAFMGLEWSAAKFLKSKKLNDTEKTPEPLPDTPVENARQLLDCRRKSTASSEQIDAFAKDFAQSIRSYEKLEVSRGDGYHWYKVTAPEPTCRLSSVLHVLGNSNAAEAVRRAGYYIAGVAKTDFRHIAIGIPACRHVCPMPQLSDCCAYTDGYHITGIFLANDGQYFEKYLQNMDN